MNHKELRAIGWMRRTISLSPEALILFNKLGKNVDEFINDLLLETED